MMFDLSDTTCWEPFFLCDSDGISLRTPATVGDETDPDKDVSLPSATYRSSFAGYSYSNSNFLHESIFVVCIHITEKPVFGRNTSWIEFPKHLNGPVF